MGSWLISAGYGRLLVYPLIAVLLAACSRIFFQPLSSHLASPEQYDIDYADIYFGGDKGPELHGWWFPSQRPARACLLFLHGNAENISTHAGLVYWLTRYQYDVFIFDYRGYGKSRGQVEIAGVLDDIQTARDYMLSHKPHCRKRFVMGHSLGASLGIYNIAAHPENIDGMIFVAPFAEYPLIARQTLSKSWLGWLFQWPISLAISSEYDPLAVVDRLPRQPKLFLYSNEDEIIDTSHIKALYKKASQPKAMERLRGGHNVLFAQTGNQQIILQYLDRWSEPRVQ